MDTIKDPALQETPIPEVQNQESAPDMEEKLKKDETFLAGRKVKNIRLIITVSVVLLLLVALFLWLEVFTVQVYLVTSEAQFDGNDDLPMSEITFEYDRDGNIIAETHWLNTGSGMEILYAEYYSYWAAGLVEHGRGANEEDTEVTHYSYDNNGHLESYYTTGLGGMKVNCRCVCDEDGNLIKETFCNIDGQATGRVKTYEYNEDDRLIEARETINGESVERIVYEYDDAGWIREEVHYDAHGNVTSKIEWEYYKGQLVAYSDGESGFECDYDNRGHITERRNYSNGEQTNRIEYTYDNLGKLTKMEYYTDSKLQRVVDVRCDMSGNPIAYTYCDEDGRPTGYSSQKTYERYRVSKKRAIEMQEAYGDDYVIIDIGWFR